VRQWRGTQRYQPLRRTDEDELTQAILALGVKYGRYGYRRITVLLQNAGWQVGRDRVQRIWRREGLKVPQKQRPPGYGCTMVRVSGCGRNEQTMCGATIS
jgi:transposase InsO family protein